MSNTQQLSRVHPEIRTQPFPFLTFDISAAPTMKSHSPDRELREPESSKTMAPDFRGTYVLK